ncbi:MAG: Na/Pi symporter [Planctomycetes bacterium]|nr:Na/Pi symporter [Planctomycetota bacterium]MCH9726180.1 Na/Pi symporter [Planctomycetota bacterium]MCH9775685.1 Na/Pi symporter [Planctomycetota bacterium]MCH9791351.1 Na/Pi symporter [Planctomycetota bacterium]
MDSGIISSLGGLGLFLLGMVIMTRGLKELAGDSIRRMIARFTRSLLSGISTGAIVTAILQSSSATTVTAVGFAGAGLLTLSQSLGIVFGANLGTTITGWIVVLFGFQFKLGQIAFPLILVGILLNLFGGRRVAAAGFALAGFGLVFVGIESLQGGMSGLANIVTPQSFPPDTWLGRLLLIFIGVGITLVTQSSSAGVAMALTAVHTGTISLAQASAMVIGFDVGTTFTALMATLGGSVAARRTGMAHVFYNIVTAVVAYFILPVYIWSWNHYWNPAGDQSPEVALVAFHSLFNFLGIVILVPFLNQFSRLITRMIPDAVNDQTERLEESLIQNPNVAIEASRSTLVDVFQNVLQLMYAMFTSEVHREQIEEDLKQYQNTLETTAQYMSRINVSEADTETLRCNQQVVLALDHIQRLTRRCKEMDRLDATHNVKLLNEIVEQLISLMHKTEESLQDHAKLLDEQPLETFWLQLEKGQKSTRRQLTESATKTGSDFETLLRQLDAFRWLIRTSFHIWRVVHHVQAARMMLKKEASEHPPSD